jgi:hypothetical protein
MKILKSEQKTDLKIVQTQKMFISKSVQNKNCLNLKIYSNLKKFKSKNIQT